MKKLLPSIPMDFHRNLKKSIQSTHRWTVFAEICYNWRRNLLPFQRSELALKVKETIRAKAKEQQLSGLKQGTSVLQKSEKRESPIHTDEELSKMAGVSLQNCRRPARIPLSKELPAMKRLSSAEIDEVKRSQQNIDPHRSVKVLSELLSRHYGYEVEMVLTPKTQEDSGG